MKRIFGNTLAYGVIPKIPTLINVFLLPVITPFLTLEDYGIWGVVSAYCSFFVSLAPLGLNVHLTNSFFEVKKWRIYWGHILYLLLLSGLFCSILYIGFILAELRYVSFNMRLLIAIFSCGPILLFAPSTISSHLYPLLSKPLPLVIRNLAASLCAISVTFIVVFYFRLGYWGWILGSFSGAVMSFLLFGYRLYYNEQIYPIREKNIRRIKYWFKISGPAIPHAIGFMLLSSSSRLIMNFYKIPLTDIGIFSNGYIMGDYVTVVSIALATALSPEIQRAYRENRISDFRHIFYFCQMTALTFVFLVSCWMPEIYRIIMRNPSLQIAAPVASIICYANVLSPLYNFLAVVVFITKETKHLLWLVFLPGVLNTALCLVFIPLFGYMTAVYSTLISFWSLLLIPFLSKFHKEKVTQWLKSRKKLLILFLLLIGAICLSLFIKDLSIIVKAIITIGLGSVYFSTLYFKRSIIAF